VSDKHPPVRVLDLCAELRDEATLADTGITAEKHVTASAVLVPEANESGESPHLFGPPDERC
jgi:hypothetical protein